MFQLIGIVVVVFVALGVIGWLFSPTVVVVQQPDQVTQEEYDPRPAIEAMARNWGRELQQLDRRGQEALQALERPRGPVDHQATIREYRERLRRS